MSYQFTRQQLSDLLDGTIAMFLEYRDVHGDDEKRARLEATREILEGLDAEQATRRKMGGALPSRKEAQP